MRRLRRYDGARHAECRWRLLSRADAGAGPAGATISILIPLFDAASARPSAGHGRHSNLICRPRYAATMKPPLSLQLAPRAAGRLSRFFPRAMLASACLSSAPAPASTILVLFRRRAAGRSARKASTIITMPLFTSHRPARAGPRHAP